MPVLLPHPIENNAPLLLRAGVGAIVEGEALLDGFPGTATGAADPLVSCGVGDGGIGVNINNPDDAALPWRHGWSPWTTHNEQDHWQL